MNHIYQNDKIKITDWKIYLLSVCTVMYKMSHFLNNFNDIDIIEYDIFEVDSIIAEINLILIISIW